MDIGVAVKAIISILCLAIRSFSNILTLQVWHGARYLSKYLNTLEQCVQRIF